MRLLALYLRGRRVPSSVAAAVAGAAALWWLDEAIDHRLGGVPALLAVAATAAVAGPGLAGPDLDLDRSGALPWPLWRAAHVVLIGVAAYGIVLVFGPEGRMVRDAAGMAGLLALGASTVGAARTWMLPTVWSVLGPAVPVRAGGPAGLQQALGWMYQPAGSTVAAVTAAALGCAGTLIYARIGPR